MDETTRKKIQLAALDNLDEFARICDKLGLTYYLAGGTLLGAIRHGGFIPWDDDCDVTMPRKDYERFKREGIKELRPEFFYHSIDNDPEFPHLLFRICKNGASFLTENSTRRNSIHEGILLDVFPLDKAVRKDGLWLNFRKRVIKDLLMHVMYSKELKEHPSEISFKKRVGLFLFKPFSLATLHKWVETLVRMDGKDAKFYANWGSKYKLYKQIIPIEAYDPPVKVKFEGKMYSAPRDWHYVLTSIYGDYMTLPPEEERVHFIPIKVSFDEDVSHNPHLPK